MKHSFDFLKPFKHIKYSLACGLYKNRPLTEFGLRAMIWVVGFKTLELCAQNHKKSRNKNHRIILRPK